MTDILVPVEQEGTRATVRAWLKRVGDRVAANDPLVELETDKVTQEVPAPADGVLLEIVLDTDAEATPGAVLGRLGAATDEAASEASAPGETQSGLAVAGEVPRAEAAEAEPARHAGDMSGFLSPAVRRAVRQHGIDPSTIPGTGRGGRVTRADVDRRVAEGPPASAERRPPQPASADGVRSIAHDRMRLAIAANMLNSVTVAPHVTAVFEADFTAISAHRRRHKAAYEAAGANLSFTAYMVAASVAAMRAAPAINARWHDDRLDVYDRVGVGVGTALADGGLVVPVVADAGSLSLLGIAQKLTDLTARARAGALTPADMRGGTFTISNHGVSGSLIATPIVIMQPQSAILGVGKLEKRVVVREVDGADAIQIRPMAYVSLTIDHRVVDGQQTNAWLTRFVEALETWPAEG